MQDDRIRSFRRYCIVAISAAALGFVVMSFLFWGETSCAGGYWSNIAPEDLIVLDRLHSSWLFDQVHVQPNLEHSDSLNLFGQLYEDARLLVFSKLLLNQASDAAIRFAGMGIAATWLFDRRKRLNMQMNRSNSRISLSSKIRAEWRSLLLLGISMTIVGNLIDPRGFSPLGILIIPMYALLVIVCSLALVFYVLLSYSHLILVALVCSCSWFAWRDSKQETVRN